MSKKLQIALLFGGNSSEHDVSKRSAHNIYDALNKDKYDVSLFMFIMNTPSASLTVNRKMQWLRMLTQRWTLPNHWHRLWP